MAMAMAMGNWKRRGNTPAATARPPNRRALRQQSSPAAFYAAVMIMHIHTHLLVAGRRCELFLECAGVRLALAQRLLRVGLPRLPRCPLLLQLLGQRRQLSLQAGRHLALLGQLPTEQPRAGGGGRRGGAR